MIARAEVRLRAGNSTDCEKDLDVVERILNSVRRHASVQIDIESALKCIMRTIEIVL